MNPSDEECYLAKESFTKELGEIPLKHELAYKEPVRSKIKESFGIRILSAVSWILLAIISLGAIPLLPVLRKLRRK